MFSTILPGDTRNGHGDDNGNEVRNKIELEVFINDDATAALSGAASRSSLARETHPDAKMRDAARECEQQIEQVNLEIAQDRGVYDALSAVDLSAADEAPMLLARPPSASLSTPRTPPLIVVTPV